MFIIGDGRMGTIIRELVEADGGLTLAGIVGIDTKETLRDQAPAADVAIDFSHKDMLPLVEAYIARTGGSRERRHGLFRDRGFPHKGARRKGAGDP